MDAPDPFLGEPAHHYRGGLSATTMLARVRELRQHQFGPYILDFYSAEKWIAIELDGVGHCSPEQQEHDWMRDNYLCARGVTVVRISNREFLANTEEALKRIAVALSPSP